MTRPASTLTRTAEAVAVTAGTVAGGVRRHRAVRALYGYGVRTVGRRFTRFAFGSALALAASEITLLVFLAAHVWPTVSAAAGWFAGALVSYILSRWAWERRGRPHLLKETLPFWVIAGCTIVALSAATSAAHHLGLAMGLSPAARLAFDGAAYLAANTLTFLARFVIFNYVLFVDRYPSAGSARSAPPSMPPAAPSSEPPEAPPGWPAGRAAGESTRESRDVASMSVR
jgi:putative flippase GtrA